VKTLKLLLEGDRFSGEVHGLNNVALAEMLAQNAPLWTLIDVTLKGKTHRWHFERIVGAVVFEGMKPEDACNAVLGALRPKDAAEVASSWSHARVCLLANLKSGDERARVVETCLAILWAAQKKGIDIDALCTGAEKRQRAEEGILSLWSMTDHEGQPPREHFALYKRAMERPEWPEALRDAFTSLPEAVRKEIQARPGDE
jgi:hypothetical protein